MVIVPTYFFPQSFSKYKSLYVVYLLQDYIMVIPVSQTFDPSVLDVRPVDKSAEFISKCGSDNFYIE